MLRVNKNKIIKELSEKYGLTTPEVREIIDSPFTFFYKEMVIPKAHKTLSLKYFAQFKPKKGIRLRLKAEREYNESDFRDPDSNNIIQQESEGDSNSEDIQF